MDKVYRKFYNNFHHSTNGFIPTQPLNRNIYPGDFFQIKNGELLVLGNIFRENIVNTDDVSFDNGIKLSPSNWNFSQGVAKSYSGRDSGHDPLKGNFEFSKQLLAFNKFGSFIFKTNDVESVKITNWSDFQEALIIKMTQTLHSFREVYIVTESVIADHWTLAIAGAEKAELELANASDNFGLIDIFGDVNTKTIQARDIEFYHHEDKRKPVFFKAKKLVVKQDKIEAFIGQLATEQSLFSPWADSFYDYNFHHDEFSSPPQIPENAKEYLLDMLKGNQLNPNTALEYFSWTDTNLEDVDKLFEGYGD